MSMINDLTDVLCRVDDRATMKRLVSELFTPAEITDVALRWRLLQMLHQNIPQRTIAAELGISLCKITRGSRILKNRGSVTRNLLDKATGDKNATHERSLQRTRR